MSKNKSDTEQKAEEYIKLLQEAINSDDKEEKDVIDVASQLLEFMPKDKDVLLCRAVAYLRLSQFDEASADLEKVPHHEFEKCLCLYGQRRYEEAMKMIRSLPAEMQRDEKFKTLEEQILLSLDDPAELKKFYEGIDLTKATPMQLQNITCGLYITGDVEDALKILESNKKVKKGSLYNIACLLVISRNYDKAMELIESGLKRCAGSPMFVQLFQILKAEVLVAKDPEHTEEAIKIYSAILENEKSHAYCKQIAASNYAGLTVDSNVHLAKKAMSLFNNNDDYHKSRHTEVESFLINRFLILHKIGQQNKVKALIEFAKKQNNIDPLIPESFQKTIDPNSSLITKYSPLFDAQNLISQGKFCEAADALSKSNFAKSPRTIVTVSELYIAGQKPDSAIEFLKKVDNGTPEFLDFAVRFAYQTRFYEQGAKWAEKLVKATGNSQQAIALYAMCLSHSDIEMAERFTQRIKITPASEAELDKLEDTPISKEIESHEHTEVTEEPIFVGEKKKVKRSKESYTPEQLQRKKEKKRRRRRLQKPANYDPQRHMDPERWVKLSKRTVKKSGNKKQNAKSSGQQQKKQKGRKGKRGKSGW